MNTHLNPTNTPVLESNDPHPQPTEPLAEPLSDSDSTSIPIARPSITPEDSDAVQRVLSSGWISQGPVVQAFEKAVANTVKASYAVATNSWTTAFHLALCLYQLGPQSDVICPSYSFIATANVLGYVGAHPHFVDIEADTLNLDPLQVEASIHAHYYQNADGQWLHQRTGRCLRAIMLVHQIGLPADIHRFEELAKRYNLILFEDSACAIGSSYKGEPIGSSGNPGGFSFHPRKVLTTGEGGVLVLPTQKLAEQAQKLRTHGMSISDLSRHQAASTVFESYEILGYNYKLTDMQAALGISQLERLNTYVSRRNEIFQQYQAGFSTNESLILPTVPHYVSTWNVQSYPLQLKENATLTRDALMAALQDKGIASRRGIPPIHQEPLYRTAARLQQQTAPLNLSVTERVSRQSLFLPIYPALSDTAVARVIETVLQALSQSGRK